MLDFPIKLSSYGVENSTEELQTDTDLSQALSGLKRFQKCINRINLNELSTEEGWKLCNSIFFAAGY